MQQTDVKRLFIVLGMHRSGTSALTRALKVFDIDLGNNHIPTEPGVNAKGFWEDRDIYTLNVDMLRALAIRWDHTTPIRPSDIQYLCLKPFFQRAQALLAARMGRYERFGIKDPRLSRLLPFWQHVFVSLDIQPHYLIALRHPASVAQSLAVRNHFRKEKSLALWLEYTMAALQHSRDTSRLVVDYDRMMHNPVSELRRIGQHWNLCLNDAELHHYSKDFLDQSLRHHQGSDPLRTFMEIGPLYKIFSVLQKAAVDQVDLDRADCCAQIDQWYRQIRPSHTSRARHTLKRWIRAVAINRSVAGKLAAMQH